MGIDGVSRVSYQNMNQSNSKAEKIEHVKLVEKRIQDITISDTKVPVKESVYTNTSEKKGEEKKDPLVAEKQIRDAINKVNSKLVNRTKCEFSYHEETKRVSIKVVDEDTKEVIREIPPEETLDMVQRIWELAGILVDEKR